VYGAGEGRLKTIDAFDQAARYGGRAGYDVLLVDDDPGDACLVREAMRRGRHTCHVHHVSDGDAALAFMRRQGDFAAAPKPHLVLLDLNMPGVSGWDVLRKVKADMELHTLPVVVLTTSDYPTDVSEAYRLGANSFVTKPVDLHQFFATIQGLEAYWFDVAKLPFS